MNETANATLCIGALPVMAHAKEEVAEMAGMAGALVLNIGTLEADWIDAMVIAGKSANEAGVPVILDPVGAGATKFRTESARRILQEVRISIIRGNAAEVSTLAGLSSEIRGVESISAGELTDDVVRAFAWTIGCTVAITGAIDRVSDGKMSARIANGDPMMSTVVGTGCISNVIVAAFAAIDKDPFTAAVGALTAYGIAGQLAAAAAPGKPGTFHAELYNALYAVTADDIRGMSKAEIV
jgi:hydroxyethylthiazole kinase